MNYWDLIGDAFRITLRNRYLWFFGFFAAGGSSFNVPSGGGNFGGQDGREAGFAPASASALAAQVSGEAFGNVALVAGIVVLALLVTLVFIVLFLISAGALADSVAAIDRGEGRRFSSAFRAGVSSFWRVLGLKALFLLMALGFVLLIFVPAGLGIVAVLAVTDSAGLRVLLIFLLVLLAIVALILVFLPFVIVSQFALRELMVGGRRIPDSIGSGFGLLRRNLGRSLLVWLVQLVVMIGLGIATLAVLAVLAVILLGPALALFATDRTTAAVAVGAAGGLLLLAPLFVISGALGTFNHAYWTLAYLRLVPPAEGTAEPARS